jgi:hypothetical protein
LTQVQAHRGLVLSDNQMLLKITNHLKHLLDKVVYLVIFNLSKDSNITQVEIKMSPILMFN